MNLPINSKSLSINENIVSDALVFMLQAYYSGNEQQFDFWHGQFDKAFKVDEGEEFDVEFEND